MAVKAERKEASASSTTFRFVRSLMAEIVAFSVLV